MSAWEAQSPDGGMRHQSRQQPARRPRPGRLRAPGLLDTVMAGHFANPPEIAELIGTNQVAAYALPLA